MALSISLLPKSGAFWGAALRVGAALAMVVPVAVLGLALGYVPSELWSASTPTEFWTLVGAVSAVLTLSITIGVGVVAWYGLRSLRLARQDMVTRATREARTLAMERAEQFSQMLRGGQKAILEELMTAGITPFTQTLQSGTAIFENNAIYPAASKWWNSVPAETRSRIVYFMNDLEAWAMYFTKALADSDVVFGPCGPTYCALVMQYSPWIVIARKEQFAGFYPNTVSLFNAWRAELDALDGGSKTEAALRAAHAATERVALHKVPAPLGTKVDI